VDYLRAHRAVFLPLQKEVPFFIYDEAYAAGERYLEPYYAARAEKPVLGIAHVFMLRSRVAATRLKEHSENARIIAVLRNPIERAYSNYWHARKLGFEDVPTFEEALAREPERAAQPNALLTDLGYVRDGEYADLLGAYFELFGRDRVHVMFTDDLADRPHQAMHELLRWLGVTDDLTGMALDERSNVAAVPRSKALHHLLVRPSLPKRLYKAIVPATAQYWIRQRIKQPLLHRNLRAADYQPMRAGTREQLRRHYEPHNRRLAELLGRPIPDWK
jgi:hypothetical protein